MNPEDVKPLGFEEIRSVEGAKITLVAFFSVLLDLNVYKEELEERVVALGSEVKENEKELAAIRAREMALNAAHRVETQFREQEINSLKSQLARDDEFEGREERRP